MIVEEEVYLAYELKDFFEHHGVKGQKWGVINKKYQAHKKGIKKAGIILGSVASAGAIAAGAVYAKKHFNVPVKSIHVAEPAKKFTESIAKEPVSIIHASRGKNHGFGFLARGNLEDPLVEYAKAGMDRHEGASVFKRYGKNLEKVAARFTDPNGRLDHAGRPIFHDVILPESMAKNVNSSEDAKKVAWPLIKDTYDALYDYVKK